MVDDFLRTLFGFFMANDTLKCDFFNFFLLVSLWVSIGYNLFSSSALFNMIYYYVCVFNLNLKFSARPTITLE